MENVLENKTLIERLKQAKDWLVQKWGGYNCYFIFHSERGED